MIEAGQIGDRDIKPVPGFIIERSCDALPTLSSEPFSLRHDLRTPINAILGYSEMLLEDFEPSPLWASLLTKINQSGQQLLQQVNQVFADSNHASSQEWLTQTQTALRHSLMGVIHSSQLLQQDMPPEAQADLSKIDSAARQMLNLVDRLCIEGTKLSLLPEIDHPSSFPSPSAPGPTEETGHKELLSQGHPPEQQLPKRHLTPLVGRVLVVDDNLTNRELLMRRLEPQGHSVVLADHGRQALALLEAEKFDLVLLDVVMPEMDGFELLNLIKTRAELRDIPVIMISALDELDSVVRCIELGAEDYLPKPFNPTLLKARIGACLEKKQLRDQEVEYLQQVMHLTAAAAAVETSNFDPSTLAEVSQRQDALGQLARVFQRMAAEVYGREQRLQQQIRQLKVEIDQEKRSRQVAEITETDFFQQLERKADTMRRKISEA